MGCLFPVSQGDTLVSVNGDALEYSILHPPIEEIWIGTGRFVVHVVRSDARVVRRKRHDFFRFFKWRRTLAALPACVAHTEYFESRRQSYSDRRAIIGSTRVAR